MMELGGNIILEGFRDYDASSMVIVKKIVGIYTRKFGAKCEKFENIKISTKPIHRGKHEIHVQVLDNAKSRNANVTDNNLFIALDAALKKIENSLD